MTEGPK